MITAIVLVNTDVGQTDEAAEALANIPGVSEVYSVTGEYDLVAIARVRNYEDMAQIVPGGIARSVGVRRTHTLMAFQHYSKRDLEAMWDLGMEQK